MSHRIKKGDRIRLKNSTLFGWKGYAVAKRDQLTDDPSEGVQFFPEGKPPRYVGLACRHEVSRCRVQIKRPPLYYEALCINALENRIDRQWLIRDLGEDLFEKHSRTSVLRELMQASIEMRPELRNELMADFNVALDGIGGWMS